MDTLSAFMAGLANRHREQMVFDWDKAARLIKESGAREARAGLADDWSCTGGAIFSEGKPNLDDYTYLASTWATPELEIDDGDAVACFRMASEVPEWGGRHEVAGVRSHDSRRTEQRGGRSGMKDVVVHVGTPDVLSAIALLFAGFSLGLAIGSALK